MEEEQKQEITFNDIPRALQEMWTELKELRGLVSTLQPPRPDRRPILIDEACRILGKARNPIYTLSRLGEIPSCRQGRKVYFYEDELLAWINNGKVKTAEEIRRDAERSVYKGTSRYRRTAN